jgi:copper transport protein
MHRPFAAILVFLAALGLAWSAPPAAAHAALLRSDPAAGATLEARPTEIRLWFSEPLEEAYTGSDLLDAAGDPVAGTAVAIAPDDDHLLVMSVPAGLPNGVYTVAWRTLSTADGHTLQGYFGFRLGAGEGQIAGARVAGTSASDAWRELTRGLALVALAVLLAIAPMILWVIDPVRQRVPVLAEPLRRNARRYVIAVAMFALAANIAALVGQATAVAPESALGPAVRETLASTRYGSLWLLRMLLMGAVGAATAVALWGQERWRRGTVAAAIALGVAAPIPFSLLSHAAAQNEGRAAAVAADALHLLLAAVWGGGLLLLAVVVLPALRPLAAEDRREAFAVAVPRFSAVGLAAWGILVLTGLYAAWLQAGTVAAVLGSPYGRTLLLKGALLLPILVLAAAHFLVGRSGVTSARSARLGRSIALEALLVVAVFLVVGRLIGQEPAREATANRASPGFTIPLSFATVDGSRTATLTISPGAVGHNSFTIAVAGDPMSEESEAVLRFSLPARDIGAQELILPADGTNQFRGDGSELGLTGEWRVEVIVRQIGAFSWSSTVLLPLDVVPPPAPMANAPPRFTSLGVAAMVAIALGIAILAAIAALPSLLRTRRLAAGAAGAALTSIGALALGQSRFPPAPPAAIASVIEAPATAVATDASEASHTGADHHRGPATPVALAVIGTPVALGELVVALQIDPARAGPTDAFAVVTDAEGAPVEGARVVVLAEMAGMAMGRSETPAVETAPGRYLAADVPLGMQGDWQIAVRVSPRGGPTATARFGATVP